MGSDIRELVVTCPQGCQIKFSLSVKVLPPTIISALFTSTFFRQNERLFLDSHDLVVTCPQRCQIKFSLSVGMLPQLSYQLFLQAHFSDKTKYCFWTAMTWWSLVRSGVRLSSLCLSGCYPNYHISSFYKHIFQTKQNIVFGQP